LHVGQRGSIDRRWQARHQVRLEALNCLRSRAAIFRALSVVFDDQDPDLSRTGTINQGVRKDAHREASPAFGTGIFDARVFDEKLRKPPELGNEPRSQHRRALALVEGRSFMDVMFSAWVKRDLHPGKRASNLAMATSSGTD